MDNNAYSISFMVLLPLMILIITRRRNESVIAKLIQRRKSKEEEEQMNELAKQFVGKDCIIYLFNGNEYTGLVKDAVDGALLVEKKGNLEIINLDFVARLREHPRNKNGKKKDLVLD